MRIENGILCDVRNEDLNKDGSFVIPDSVTSIGDGAFYNCFTLTSVTIGNSVTDIKGGAFFSCTKLASVTIPNSVTSIGQYAFYGCSGLSSQKANYKAFNLTKSGKLRCLNKTYAIGKQSFVKGKLELCENGIHYCTNLFDIFNYYYGEYGKDFVIGVCEVSDEKIKEYGTSKHCARWVVPTKILTKEEVFRIMNGEDTE